VTLIALVPGTVRSHARSGTVRVMLDPGPSGVMLAAGTVRAMLAAGTPGRHARSGTVRAMLAAGTVRSHAAPSGAPGAICVPAWSADPGQRIDGVSRSLQYSDLLALTLSGRRGEACQTEGSWKRLRIC